MMPASLVRAFAIAAAVLVLGLGIVLGRCSAPDPAPAEPLLPPAVVEDWRAEYDSALAVIEQMRADSAARAVLVRPVPAPVPVLADVVPRDTPGAASTDIIVDATKLRYVWILLGGDTALAPFALVASHNGMRDLLLDTQAALRTMTADRDASRALAALAAKQRDDAIERLHAAQARLDKMEPACRADLKITAIPCPSRTTSAVAGFAGAMALLFALAR